MNKKKVVKRTPAELPVIQDSGDSIKKIAISVAALVMGLGFLILNGSPTRSDGEQAKQAVKQVQQFAKFIETRPELTAPRNPFERNLSQPSAGVLTSTPQSPSKPVDADTRFPESDFRDSLAQYLDPEANQKLAKIIQTHPETAFYYFRDQLNQREIAHDPVWESNIEGLLLLSSTGHEGGLDLLGEQLIAARSDDEYHIQRKTDEWFQRYLASERRPDKIRVTVDAFAHIIEQKSMRSVAGE
jgi:hypothetical protein